MSGKYYYLVASLPYLSFGDEPPFAVDGFIAECEKWLSPEDMKKLLSASPHCTDEECEGTQFLRIWKKFDLFLREELTRFRAARKKGESYRVHDILKHIVDQETPFLMEKALERLRWRFIEEQSKGYFFDIDSLISYFLRLQILGRLAGFNKDEGEKFFYSLCEVKYEQAVGQNSSH
jgi:hypothetical protein